MKGKIFAIIICLAVSFLKSEHFQAQNIDRFVKAMVASDTILDGSTFEFKIIIRNLSGDYTPPALNDFDIVGGPNMSTNMKYINGEMFKEYTYTYILRARKIGEQYIEEAYLKIEDENIETEAIPILVLDNPEGIKKKYRLGNDSKTSFFFPLNTDPDTTNKKKKKRPLKKI